MNEKTLVQYKKLSPQKSFIVQILQKKYKHVRLVSVSSTHVMSTPHRRFRGIECRVLKMCDFKKVTFSLFFKHNIAGLGVLIPKRYHMLG